MYELIQVSEHDYYMDCPAKVGFVKTSESEVILIDSGSDKDSAKKVKKILDEKNWKLTAIYNTHSHADHIGGNQYLQNQTGCKIFAPGIEKCFTEYPELEPLSLYGGYPLPELLNKFLLAKESNVEKLDEASVPYGLEVIHLPGHCFDMVGYRTKDDTVFIADSLSSEDTLNKYKIGYVYDIKSYIDTLEFLKTLNAKCFVPSHAEMTNDIEPMAQLNIDKTNEIAGTIMDILSVPMSFDELLKNVFDRFELTMTIQQNALVGSTLRSYLTYLKKEGNITFTFENNMMLWQKNI